MKTETTKTIHQQLKDTGVEISTHASDLWVPVTPETQKIVDEYEYKSNVRTFVSLLTGEQMFDIPFANDDYRKFQRKDK